MIHDSMDKQSMYKTRETVPNIIIDGNLYFWRVSLVTFDMIIVFYFDWASPNFNQVCLCFKKQVFQT